MKKIKFSLTVIKIFMKNQIQNKTYILLDISISNTKIIFQHIHQNNKKDTKVECKGKENIDIKHQA